MLTYFLSWHTTTSVVVVVHRKEQQHNSGNIKKHTWAERH